jgi:hypothetical protein
MEALVALWMTSCSVRASARMGVLTAALSEVEENRWC